MTEPFAPPPAPDGTPQSPVKRAEFRPTPPARRRTGFPRWVAVLLGIGLVAIVAGVVAQLALTARTGNVTAADPEATGRLHSVQVVSGMCIEELGDEAGPVVVVPCSDPHRAEVVSMYTFTGTTWPGEASAASTALNYCASQLAPGGPLASAADGREWVAWLPSSRTWQTGDRDVLCIVTSDEPWTGRATAGS